MKEENKTLEAKFKKMIRKLSMLTGLNNGNKTDHDKKKKIP